jgi:hypothetical protein
MGIEFGWEYCQKMAICQAAVHPHHFAVADGSASANASNRVKADQKAFNLGSGYRDISIAPQVNLERGQEYARRNDGARRLRIFPALPKVGATSIVTWRICAPG